MFWRFICPRNGVLGVSWTNKRCLFVHEMVFWVFRGRISGALPHPHAVAVGDVGGGQGGVRLLVALATEGDVAQGHDEQQQQDDGDNQRDGALVGRLTLYVVDAQLVAEALHGVDQDDVVDGVVGQSLLLQRRVGLLPAAGALVDERDNLVGLFAKRLVGHCHGLVGVAQTGFVAYLHRAAVDAALPLGDALLVFLVAFHELWYVTSVEEAQCLARLNVEDPLGGVFLGYLLRLVQQFVGLLGVVVQRHVHEVHIDRWHTLVVACLLHHLDDLAEVLLRRLPVAAVAVQVSQHVVGHIHLLVELLL